LSVGPDKQIPTVKKEEWVVVVVKVAEVWPSFT